MATTGKDPIIVHRFGLEVQQIESATFTKVSGFDNKTDIAETYQTDKVGKVYIQKHPANSKWGTITLERGIIADNSLWNWRMMVINGAIDAARADATLTAYAPDGSIVMQYTLIRCWPAEYSGPSFDAKGAESGMEKVTLAHEGMIRLK